MSLIVPISPRTTTNKKGQSIIILRCLGNNMLSSHHLMGYTVKTYNVRQKRQGKQRSIYIYTHCISTLIWTRTHRLSRKKYSFSWRSTKFPTTSTMPLGSGPLPPARCQPGAVQASFWDSSTWARQNPTSLVLWRWVTVKANQKKWLKFWCSLMKSVQIFISSTCGSILVIFLQILPSAGPSLSLGTPATWSTAKPQLPNKPPPRSRCHTTPMPYVGILGAKWWYNGDLMGI